MSIPPLNISGVLPPFTGQDPGQAGQDLSPYSAQPVDVITAFGTSAERLDILKKWLDHRKHLRQLGLASGFQWLDGSFVENKVPSDLDIVTFFLRPRATNANDMAQLMLQNPTLFLRAQAKATYRLDVFWVDMNARPEAVVDFTRYYCGLFSHRRIDFLWKGILRVDLAAQAIDDIASAAIQQAAALQPAGTPSP
jgi:hypothetical protein